ncbi:hypothetical protein [Blastomonas sp.]|uniref:hypothetical protein n=1 Tax=Blastomonas sp. TaxID=1909299 RepID=UPI003592E93C
MFLIAMASSSLTFGEPVMLVADDRRTTPSDCVGKRRAMPMLVRGARQNQRPCVVILPILM